MQFHIATIVIAFILQDYGTFQIKPLEDRTSSELAEIFKEHALELVTAAIQPLLKNQIIMDGACECIKNTQKEEDWNPLDQILAIISIAKYYEKDLEVIRRTKDLSTIKIDDELLRNIRAIVIGHDCSLKSDSDCSLSDDADEHPKEYLRAAQLKIGSSSAATQTLSSDESEKSDVSCYRTILSIYSFGNYDFFHPLFDGLHIVGALIDGGAKNADDDASISLRATIEKISRFELFAYDLDDTINEYKHLVDSLDDIEDEDSDLDSR